MRLYKIMFALPVIAGCSSSQPEVTSPIKKRKLIQVETPIPDGLLGKNSHGNVMISYEDTETGEPVYNIDLVNDEIIPEVKKGTKLQVLQVDTVEIDVSGIDNQ